MREKSIEGFKKYETMKEAIDEITQLGNLTYDLHGLTRSVAVMFESNVELSPETEPKPFARLIDKQAIDSLVYLVQRSADIADKLNTKLHETLQRLPYDQLSKAPHSKGA